MSEDSNDDKPEKSASDHSRFSSDTPFQIVRPNEDGVSLTEQTYADLIFAQEYLNERLFGDQLKGCILGFARMKNVLGYFCPDRFVNEDGETAHEITLNPTYLRLRTDRDTLSTLAHEMVHHWRHDHGPANARGGKGSRGYHDKVWSAKMLEIGLTPTSTGEPGGDMTGYRMTHLIDEGGQFDLDSAEFLAGGFHIRWADKPQPIRVDEGDDAEEPNGAAPTPPKKKKDRVKFTCPDCEQNAWARPAARLVCADCGLALQINDN